MGGVSSNQGLFSEEYFINSLENSDKNLFGKQFDKLITKLWLPQQENSQKGRVRHCVG